MERWFREWQEQSGSTKGRKDFTRLLQEALSGGVLEAEHLNALRMLQQRCRSNIKATRPSDALCAKVESLLSGKGKTPSGPVVGLNREPKDEVRADDPWNDTHQLQWNAWVERERIEDPQNCLDALKTGKTDVTCKNTFDRLMADCNDRLKYPGSALCRKLIAHRVGTHVTESDASSEQWALETYENLRSVNGLSKVFGKLTQKQTLTMLSEIHALSPTETVKSDLRILTRSLTARREFPRLRAYCSLQLLHLKPSAYNLELVQQWIYGVSDRRKLYAALNLPRNQNLENASPRTWLAVYVARHFVEAWMGSESWKTHFPAFDRKFAGASGGKIRERILRSFTDPKLFAQDATLGWIDAMFAEYYAGQEEKMVATMRTYLILTHPNEPRFIATAYNIESAAALLDALRSHGIASHLFKEGLTDAQIQVLARELIGILYELPNDLSLIPVTQTSKKAKEMGSLFRSLFVDFDVHRARLLWAELLLQERPHLRPLCEAWVLGASVPEKLLGIERSGGWKSAFGYLTRAEAEEGIELTLRSSSLQILLDYFRLIEMGLANASKVDLLMTVREAKTAPWWNADTRLLRFLGLRSTIDEITNALLGDIAFVDACRIIEYQPAIAIQSIKKTLTLGGNLGDLVDWTAALERARSTNSYSLRSEKYVEWLRDEYQNTAQDQYIETIQILALVAEQVELLFAHLRRTHRYALAFGNTPIQTVEAVLLRLFSFEKFEETRRHFREMHRLLNSDDGARNLVPYLMYVFPQEKSRLKSLQTDPVQ